MPIKSQFQMKNAYVFAKSINYEFKPKWNTRLVSTFARNLITFKGLL